MPGPYPLTNLGVVIDPNGITAPTFEDVLQSLIAHYQSVYGSDIYLGADSQDYQWIAIQSQVIYDCNQAVIAAYFSYSPTYAQGIGLSSVVKINGIARQAPSRGTVQVTIVGQVGTVITNGAVGDSLGTIWDLPASVTIPPTGEISVTATARDVGAARADAGTVNRIMTLQPGWQSVTNPEAAQPGIPLESDATLRRRQTISVSQAAITPREAILGAVSNVSGAGQCQVYDNDTDMMDPLTGIPAHSIAVVAEGGDSMQIATQILYHKNLGCGTYGTTQVAVFDQRGTPQTINFFYATFVDIYVTVVIHPLVGYHNSTGNLIRAAVMQYITHMNIGDDIFNSWLYAPARLAGDAAVEATGLDQLALDKLSVTYRIDRIMVGTEPNPTETGDVQIDFHSVTTTKLDNVGIQIA